MKVKILGEKRTNKEKSENPEKCSIFYVKYI